MEGVVVDPALWRGRRVLVTGHTGFKGSWLCLWLGQLGAEVHGFGLPVPTTPSLHDLLSLPSGTTGDIRDIDAVTAAIKGARPEVVFHLAAQPLVRHSYLDPIGTYDTNVMGTANVLEAARSEARVVVVVTSDKCYEPHADGAPCREGDPLGGADPYSSSKACAELVTAAYRRSFAGDGDGGPAIASARAGNVIGGGDWAADRLVPDAMRAALAGQALAVRNPDAVRPWQHVLSPLSGYLRLAEALWQSPAAAGAWNFGPDAGDERPVRWIADRVCGLWGSGLRWASMDDGGPAETAVLRLDSSKARSELGWAPGWDLEAALGATVDWFRAYRDGADVRALCAAQIQAFAEQQQ
ncbi:MAG: CDP-glucose 4,6-dehydratase [Thermoleophilaceae bacterium]|nr:CDP-glucose 4,6-dehydratase [Thermoleophilaceae bacterium]